MTFCLSIQYVHTHIYIYICVCVCVCVCVCICEVSDFTYSYFFLCMCESFFEIFCKYIYIFICVCVCEINILFNFGSTLCINFFSFISSSVLLIVCYIGIIFNLPRLHLYRYFATFNVLFSSILILLHCSNFRPTNTWAHSCLMFKSFFVSYLFI